MLNVYAQALMEPSQGKGAVFVRALLEYLSTQDEAVPLRQAQEAALKVLIDKGSSISLNYMKSNARNLQDAGLIEQVRHGKMFTVEITQQGEYFLKALPADWGTNPQTEMPAHADPIAISEVMERPNRRLKGGEIIDREVWKAYFAAWKAGELDVIFVKAGAKVRLIK